MCLYFMLHQSNMTPCIACLYTVSLGRRIYVGSPSLKGKSHHQQQIEGSYGDFPSSLENTCYILPPILPNSCLSAMSGSCCIIQGFTARRSGSRCIPVHECWGFIGHCIIPLWSLAAWCILCRPYRSSVHIDSPSRFRLLDRCLFFTTYVTIN